MRVAPPSSGVRTVALPFSTPIAEFEVPKSKPQAIMETPSSWSRGYHICPRAAACQTGLFFLGSAHPMGWPGSGRFPAHRQLHTRQCGASLDAARASARFIPVANTKRGHAMEYRLLGRSGLKVSTITLGTMTMGGKGDFAKVGDVGVAEARRQIDLCIDAGLNLLDTADVYSDGASEEIIGEALGGKRKGGLLIATKARFATGEGPNDG